ncbi:MAG: hypothetical protein IJK26_05680 [Clostridia bacterium]|nr:hypothetical protein [Clostridia bacterium]
MPIGKHYDLDIDSTLSGNSDIAIASQKAVKSYVDNGLSGKQDSLPSQTGQSGKYLTTDGSSLSWGTPSSGGSSTLSGLSDVTITSATSGQVLKYDGSKWINASQPSWSLTTFTNNTGTTLDTQLTLSNAFSVFKNGQLLTATTDYTVSGSVITFVVALQSDDIIRVLNCDMSFVPVANTETITSTAPSIVAQANTNYVCSNALTSLTISSAPNSPLETNIYFTTGSSFAFTNSSSLTKWIGTVPTFNTATKYVINICNGIMVAAEIVEAS